jgi:hypothetical protein
MFPGFSISDSLHQANLATDRRHREVRGANTHK